MKNYFILLTFIIFTSCKPEKNFLQRLNKYEKHVFNYWKKKYSYKNDSSVVIIYKGQHENFMSIHLYEYFIEEIKNKKYINFIDSSSCEKHLIFLGYDGELPFYDTQPNFNTGISPSCGRERNEIIFSFDIKTGKLIKFYDNQIHKKNPIFLPYKNSHIISKMKKIQFIPPKDFKPPTTMQ